jgi:hypothetical protein
MCPFYDCHPERVSRSPERSERGAQRSVHARRARFLRTGQQLVQHKTGARQWWKGLS